MTPRHVVMFSGGISSWAAAKRVAHRHGTDTLVLLFADTRVEDPDVYRFLADAATNVTGQPAAVVRVADGRTPWEVFHAERFLGNARLAPCAKRLKQAPSRAWLTANTDPAATTVYVGIDWTETHRLPAIQRGYRPWTVAAPLCDRPLVDKPALLAWARREGLQPPQMYADGFPHANCFHPDTRFITSEGIRSLRDCLGQRVWVIGRGGGWRQAEVRSFGRQPLWELCVRRGTDQQSILVTPDHRWPVGTAAGPGAYQWAATSALRPGQQLAGNHGQLRSPRQSTPAGIPSGCTFGPGNTTWHPHGQARPAPADGCGRIHPTLPSPTAATQVTDGSSAQAAVHDLPHASSQPPGLRATPSSHSSRSRGAYAADHTVANQPARLTAAHHDPQTPNTAPPRIGGTTTPIRTGGRGTHVPSDPAAPHLHAVRSAHRMVPQNRRRLDDRADVAPWPGAWHVVTVRDTGRVEEVMCAVVPDGNVFTLDGNLLTHNCGGACVRGGQAQWARLLTVHPDRFAAAERHEQALRAELGEVAILRDRRGGHSRPLPLATFRERLAGQPPLFDTDEWGGCGCLAGDWSP